MSSFVNWKTNTIIAPTCINFNLQDINLRLQPETFKETATHQVTGHINDKITCTHFSKAEY